MPYLVILSFTPTPYSRRIQPKAHFDKASYIKKIFLCGAYAPRCFDCAHAPLNMTVKRISHPEPYSNAPLTKDPAEGAPQSQSNYKSVQLSPQNTTPHHATKAAARPKILRRLLKFDILFFDRFMPINHICNLKPHTFLCFYIFCLPFPYILLSI